MVKSAPVLDMQQFDMGSRRVCLRCEVVALVHAGADAMAGGQRHFAHREQRARQHPCRV